MTVFYRGPHALITQDLFKVARIGHRHYMIQDLANVQVVRHEPDGALPGDRVLGLSALVTATITAVLVGQESALLAAVVGVAAALCAAVWLRDDRQVRWELVAVYRGELTILFTTLDEREFGQVCRGLRRSLERRADSAQRRPS